MIFSALLGDYLHRSASAEIFALESELRRVEDEGIEVKSVNAALQRVLGPLLRAQKERDAAIEQAVKVGKENADLMSRISQLNEDHVAERVKWQDESRELQSAIKKGKLAEEEMARKLRAERTLNLELQVKQRQFLDDRAELENLGKERLEAKVEMRQMQEEFRRLKRIEERFFALRDDKRSSEAIHNKLEQDFELQCNEIEKLREEVSSLMNLRRVNERVEQELEASRKMLLTREQTIKTIQASNLQKQHRIEELEQLLESKTASENSQIEKLERFLREKNLELQEMTVKMQNLQRTENQNEHLVQEIEQMKEKLRANNFEAKKLKESLEFAGRARERIADSFRRRIKSSEEFAASLRVQIQQLRAHNEALAGQVSASEKAKENRGYFREQLAEERRNLEKAKTELEKVFGQVRQLEQELVETVTDKESHASEILRLQKELFDAQREISILTNQNRFLLLKIEKLYSVQEEQDEEARRKRPEMRIRPSVAHSVPRPNRRSNPSQFQECYEEISSSSESDGEGVDAFVEFLETKVYTLETEVNTQKEVVRTFQTELVESQSAFEDITAQFVQAQERCELAEKMKRKAERKLAQFEHESSRITNFSRSAIRAIAKL